LKGSEIVDFCKSGQIEKALAGQATEKVEEFKKRGIKILNWYWTLDGLIQLSCLKQQMQKRKKQEIQMSFISQTGLKKLNKLNENSQLALFSTVIWL
jgi:hypothetical protein